VDAEPILVRENRHGAHIEFRARAKNPHGDFAAVGRHQFLDWANGGRG
jgi:hypothetical protein